MNILKALFGKKKLPALFGHLDTTLKEVNRCVSIPALTAYMREYSGYVREAALARCVQLGAVELLPAVTERLNDWVPQVRQSARSTLMTLLPFVPTPLLLSTLPAVLRLLDASRAAHSEWIPQFELALIRQVEVQDLVNAALGLDVKVARACFEIIRKHELIDAADLAAMMLRSQDDIVLAHHAVTLCAILPVERQRDLYGIAEKSHFGAVRTLALRALLSNELEANKDQIATRALLDVQSSVRSVAMAYLTTRNFDLHFFYRNVLQGSVLSAQQTQVSLISLASLPGAADLELIKSFTAANHTSVRKAAFAAWIKMVEGDKDIVALAALKDEAASVRKYALHLVRRHGAYIPFSVIRTVLEDPALLLSFSEMNKWNWLECIAMLAMRIEPDEQLSPLLEVSLRNWAARSGAAFEVPSMDQAEFVLSRGARTSLETLAGDDRRIMEVLAVELSQIHGSAVRPRQ